MMVNVITKTKTTRSGSSSSTSSNGYAVYIAYKDIDGNQRGEDLIHLTHFSSFECMRNLGKFLLETMGVKPPNDNYMFV